MHAYNFSGFFFPSPREPFILLTPGLPCMPFLPSCCRTRVPIVVKMVVKRPDYQSKSPENSMFSRLFNGAGNRT